MTRTERLYALVEELRAVAPRPRSAGWLSKHFEISARTVERDIAALQQAGVPIYAVPGRTGGYAVDKDHTLAPLTITAGEATALAVGLRALAGTPFAADARAALQKVLAVMPEPDRVAADRAGRRIGFVTTPTAPPAVPRALSEALTARRVLRLSYADRHGVPTDRDVEPLGFLGGGNWYLLAWCRLRDCPRGFRLDRIRAVTALDETPPAREVDLAEFAGARWAVRPLDVTANTDSTVSRRG